MEKEIGWLLQEKYNGKMTLAARRDIERLNAGEPLDHIIGFVDFLGCKILVGPDALIPRPETEDWVGKSIETMYYKKETLPKHSIRVLDIFSGSGCVGIAILKHVKNVKVVFADSEKPALAQIKKNIKANRLDNSYELVSGDIFENVRGKFDYIFANPPYISSNTETRNKIQKSVLNYEPHVALFGGEDGLDLIQRFLASAKNRINEGGKIYMEFDSPQKSAIARLLKKHGYEKWDFHRDQYGKYRYVVVQ